MFIIIVFRLGCDRPSGLLLFVPAVLFSIFILAVPMRECLGSQFPIAILNGTSSFLSLVQENINMLSGHYYRLCS